MICVISPSRPQMKYRTEEPQIEKIEDHKELKNFFTDNPLNIAIGKPYDEEYTKNAIKNVIIHSQKEKT